MGILQPRQKTRWQNAATYEQDSCAAVRGPPRYRPCRTTAGASRGLVVMPVVPVHVLVLDLFRSRRAHVRDFQHKPKRLAGQRMIAVEENLVALDLHDVEHV